MLQAGVLEACLSPRVAASPLQLVLLLLAHPDKSQGRGACCIHLSPCSPATLMLHLWSLSSAELCPVMLQPAPAIMVGCVLYRAVPRAGSPFLGTPDDPCWSWVQGNEALVLAGLPRSEQNQASPLLGGNSVMPEMMLVLQGRSVQG